MASLLTVRLPAVSWSSELDAVPAAGSDAGDVSVLAGLRVIAGDRDARLVVGLLTVRMLMIGAADVLFVLLALDLLEMGEPGAGILAGALGAGAMVGGALTFTIVGRSRLAAVVAVGALAWGVVAGGHRRDRHRGARPVAGRRRRRRAGHRRHRRPDDAPAIDPRRGPGAGVRAAGGPGDGGAGRGLDPRARSSSRSPGWSVAVLVVAAILPVVVALLVARRCASSTRRTLVPVRELALLRRNTIFRPLPAPQLEAVARRAVWLTAPAGNEIIREGDAGDRFYVLASGALTVDRHGATCATSSVPGDGVGEIALLRDVPRTATGRDDRRFDAAGHRSSAVPGRGHRPSRRVRRRGDGRSRCACSDGPAPSIRA